VTGSCEHGNDSSCSIKGEEFLDYISDYHLFQKGSVPCSSNVRPLKRNVEFVLSTEL
jgi:hypothetical protein